MPHIISFVKPQPIDELTGTFNALNETTNFRPTQSEAVGVIHPSYKPDPRGYDAGPIGSLSETLGDGDPRILGPISDNGVFKPQDIDTRGSIIIGDNHFMPDRGGDSITGDGRPMNIWGNGGASTFEDSKWIWQDCNNVKSDQDNNDVVIGVGENIDWTAANGGPGSSYLTAKNAIKSNAYVDEDVDGFMKLGDIKGELQTTDLRSDTRFVIERFDPAIGMDSFGESLEPSLQLGTHWCPGRALEMTGKIGDDSGQMISPLSGGDGCAF